MGGVNRCVYGPSFANSVELGASAGPGAGKEEVVENPPGGMADAGDAPISVGAVELNV